MKMHRNEAKEYINDLISKGKYDEAMNTEIEWIPLDLSGFPQLKADTAKWINSLFSEETEDRHGNYMLRGLTYNSAREKELLGCTYGDAGCDSNCFYAYNDDEYLLYSYCEHDTTCTLFADKAKYLAEKAENERWYREER